MITRGAITVQSVGDKLLAVSLGSDLKHPETEVIIPYIDVYYIDDLIAALKAYKQKEL